MPWQISTLTTAAPTKRVSFVGGGSIYAEGTFGGGALELHPIADADSSNNDVETISTGSLYTIDGATTVSADVPSGHYQLKLANSLAASINVFINDQLAVNLSR